METSASFEARSAPWSYPAAVRIQPRNRSSLRGRRVQVRGRQYPAATAIARSGRLAGVPSPRHAPQGWPRNRRELPILSHQEDRLWKWVGRYVPPRVDRRKRGRIWEQSYNPIVLTKGENRRAPARGGHGIHRRDGGSRRTNLLKGDITRLRTRAFMCTDIDRIAELAKEDPKR